MKLKRQLVRKRRHWQEAAASLILQKEFRALWKGEDNPAFQSATR